VRTGIALVIDVKKAGVEMNRTATWALLAHTTITLQSITHSTSAGRHPVRHWGLVVALLNWRCFSRAHLDAMHALHRLHAWIWSRASVSHCSSISAACRKKWFVRDRSPSQLARARH